MSVEMDALQKLINKYARHPEFIGIHVTGPDDRGAVGDTLLHLVSRLGLVDEIRTLASAGATINMSGDLGNTPLHHASMMGQLDAVRLLLDLGADRRIVNIYGQTPYDLAVLGNRQAVAQLLGDASPTT